MAAWLDRLEHFLGHYPRIIAAVEAISTLAAVVVALYLARRSETVRFTALLTIGVSTTDPSWFVKLHINNIGIRSGVLAPPPFFEWRVPFRRHRQPETMVNTINTSYMIQRDKIPNTITVGSPFDLLVTDIDTFRSQFTGQLALIDDTLRYFPKTRLKRLGAVIYTNEDRRFRVTFSKVISAEIRSLVDAYLWKKTRDAGR